MSLPIVFLHKGNQEFIRYSLLKASQTNPSSIVYLIGDDSNKIYDRIAENVVWKDYRTYEGELSETLAERYVHMSTNPAPYEYICIDRWFLINEFMKFENINPCFIVCTNELLSLIHI